MRKELEGGETTNDVDATAIGGDVRQAGDIAAETAFERVKAQLKARLGADVYTSWFGRMKLAETSRSVVRMSVPTAFLRSWINAHYLDLVTELWRAELPGLIKVEIVVRTAARPVRPVADTDGAAPARGNNRRVAAEKVADNHNQRHAAPEARQPLLGSPLDPRYTFSSFVEGSSNRVAFSAARTVADQATNAASSTRL